MNITLTIKDIKSNTSIRLSFNDIREVINYLKDNNINTNSHLERTFEISAPPPENLSKVWRNFYDKISKYKTTPELEWNEYQFLGYLQNKLRFPIDVKKCEPNCHPLRLRMKKLIATIEGDKLMSAKFDRQRVMDFITYALEVEKAQELNDLFSIVSAWMLFNPIIKF